MLCKLRLANEGNVDMTRVYNHDKTPQFVNYGVDGTPSGLCYVAKVESCKKLSQENRECVSIHPLVSFPGDVIFGAKGISSHMTPTEGVQKVEKLFICTTERGCQDHESLLVSYKVFDEYLTEKMRRLKGQWLFALMGTVRGLTTMCWNFSKKMNASVLKSSRHNWSAETSGPD